MKIRNSVLKVFGLAALMALGACANAGKEPAATLMADKRVIFISGNGAQAVVVPTSDGGVTAYSNSDKPMCAECMADSKKYFLTGQLTEKCAACGATRTVGSPIMTPTKH